MVSANKIVATIVVSLLSSFKYLSAFQINLFKTNQCINFKWAQINSFRNQEQVKDNDNNDKWMQRQVECGMLKVGQLSQRMMWKAQEYFLSGITVLITSASLSIFYPQHVLAANTDMSTVPPSMSLDRVERVVDGDTVILSNIGRVRLIGMNTPETVAPAQRQGAPPQCYGPEASSYTKNLLPKGTEVRLETDVEATDKFGRSLVYLFLQSDDMFVNGQLVKEGYARAKTYGQNMKYDSLLKQYQTEAKQSKRGIWRFCDTPTSASKTNLVANTIIVDSGSDGNIAPASNEGQLLTNPGDTKNCGDFSSYDDAKAWYDKYFSLYGDVAKLDGDGDGIPCEKLRRQR